MSAYQCGYCDDLGYINLDNKIVPCPKPDCKAGKIARNELAQRMIKFGNVPAMYLNATLDAFDKLDTGAQKGKITAYNVGKAFTRSLSVNPLDVIPAEKWGGGAEPRNWLVFSGPVGTGKTYLACAIVNAVHRSGKNARYTRLDDLMREITESYENNGESASKILARYYDYTVLLIDEVNLERVSEHSKQIVESILRHRYMHDKPTILTANITLAEFKAMWGERTSTIVMDKSIWIAMSGYNLRKQTSAVASE